MRTAALLHIFARPPWPALFALTAAGLALSAIQAGQAALPAFCGPGAARLALAGGPAALRLLLEINPPARLLADWGLMMLAMMPPLLAVPLGHVLRSSLVRRRVRAVACFSLGYGAAWLAAGPVLIALALLLQLLAGGAALAAALLGAAIWSASPWQRAALNRGHRLGRIGIFGWAADRDCLAFGLGHGGWCIAACWPWMLAPLAAGPWHLPAMVVVGGVLLAQRLAPPSTPRWRPPAPLAPLQRRLGSASRGGHPLG